MSDIAFAGTGAMHFRAVVRAEDTMRLCEYLQPVLSGRPGRRLTDGVQPFLEPINQLARSILGQAAIAVRVVAFDKSPEANWSVGWHQDRTIAVQERFDVEGFGPWSD